MANTRAVVRQSKRPAHPPRLPPPPPLWRHWTDLYRPSHAAHAPPPWPRRLQQHAVTPLRCKQGTQAAQRSSRAWLARGPWRTSTCHGARLYSHVRRRAARSLPTRAGRNRYPNGALATAQCVYAHRTWRGGACAVATPLLQRRARTPHRPAALVAVAAVLGAWQSSWPAVVARSDHATC